MEFDWTASVPDAIVDVAISDIEDMYSETPTSDLMGDLTRRLQRMPTGVALNHPETLVRIVGE